MNIHNPQNPADEDILSDFCGCVCAWKQLLHVSGETTVLQGNSSVVVTHKHTHTPTRTHSAVSLD